DAYAHQLPKGAALLQVEDVLTLFAQPDFIGKYTDTLVTRTLRDHITEELEQETRHEDREALMALMGKADIGLGLHVAAAADGIGKPAMLFVIEDSVRNQMLVAGEKPISTELSAALKEAGVTYVNRRAASAAGDIEDFIAASADGQRPG